MKTMLIAAVLALLTTGALAAEPIQIAAISDMEGKVLVNKGKGFVSARSGMALNSGDRVIALDGSRASVVYADGCVSQLRENSLLALQKTDRCGQEAVRTSMGSTQTQPVRLAQAIGDTRTDGIPGLAGDGINWWLVAAGGAGAAVVIGSTNSNKAISPQ